MSSRYSIARRHLHWDGAAGSYAFGHTRRTFSERPDVGIADMESVEYSPHELIYRVHLADGTKRALTQVEIIGIEDRMYAGNRGAGDPFRNGWRK